VQHFESVLGLNRLVLCTVGLVASLEISLNNFELLGVNDGNCVVVVLSFWNTSASQWKMCFSECV